MHGAGARTVVVTMSLRARAGREDALAGALRELAAVVRREEPGCLEYRAARSQNEPLHFLVVERYRDEEALAAHANSEHLREALPSLMDCLEEPPRVAIFDALAADDA